MNSFLVWYKLISNIFQVNFQNLRTSNLNLEYLASKIFMKLNVTGFKHIKLGFISRLLVNIPDPEWLDTIW